MRLPTTIVLVLILAGIGVMFVGIVMRSIEEEYGSGLNFTQEFGRTGIVTVYEIDEIAGKGQIVFVGTLDEANDYTRKARDARESFLVPNLTIGVGMIMLLTGSLSGALSIADHVFMRHRPPDPLDTK